MSTLDAFRRAFADNVWGDAQSRSGPGSSLVQTEAIRAELPALLRKYGIVSLLDVPCGDCFWIMSPAKSAEDDILSQLGAYLGADVVPELVSANAARYASEKIQFCVLDLARGPLPYADMVLIRDCFIHLPFRMILSGLQNAQSAGIKYLLASTYTKRRGNRDVAGPDLVGRAISLCDTPFSFPPPIECINERCTEGNGEYIDKSLALWRLTDLDLVALERRVVRAVRLGRLKRFLRRLGRAPSAIVRRVRTRLTPR